MRLHSLLIKIFLLFFSSLLVFVSPNKACLFLSFPVITVQKKDSKIISLLVD